MEKSDSVIGKVVSIHGKGYVRLDDGTLVLLKAGEPVREGEIIVTSQNAAVDIVLNNGNVYTVLQNQTVILDERALSDGNQAILTDRHELLAPLLSSMINGNDDLSNALPVQNNTGDGEQFSDADSGHYFVQLATLNDGLTAITITNEDLLSSIPAYIEPDDAGSNNAGFTLGNVHGVYGAVIVLNPIGTISIGQASSSAPVIIGGTITGNVPPGSTVTITVGGHGYTGPVQSGSGSFAVDVPGDVLGGAGSGTLQATLTTVNSSGNTITSVTEQGYTVAPAAIAIAIDPIASITPTQAATSTPVTITGEVSATVPTGSIVTLTVGSQSYTGVVQSGGTYSIGIPANVLASATVDTVHASVSVTNATGQASTATADQSYTVLPLAAITIDINPIAQIPSNSTAPVAITGTVSASVPVGDTVTLTVDGHSYTGVVQAGGTYSISIPGNILSGASVDTVHASVVATNAAGNAVTATADQVYTVSVISPPAIAVTIDPIATLDAAQAASAAPIVVSGTVNAGVPAGSVVTLTVGGHSYIGTVQAGGTYSIGIPGNVMAGASVDSVHASVSVTNSSGQVATATADLAYSVNTAGSSIGLVLDPIAPVNSAQASGSTPVTVTGTASGVPAGTVVTVTVGGHSYNGTVQSGGTYTVNVPGNVMAASPSQEVQVSVSTGGANGSSSSVAVTQPYTVDTTPPVVSVTLDAVPAINGAQAASSNPITLHGSVSGDVPAGATVTATVGGHTYTAIVQVGGLFSIGVPGNVLAVSHNVLLSVAVTDGAGNVGNASVTQNYTVELTAPPISVTVNPITPVTSAQASSSTAVTVSGTVSANVPAGTVVTATVDGHTYNGTVQAGTGGGQGTFSISVPGDVLAAAPTGSVQVSVSTTDAAGNVATASADQPYSVNAPGAVVVVLDPIATINGAEAASSNPVAITGTVNANVPVGDTVTLSVNGHAYTGTVQTGGTFSIGIPGNVLAGDSSVHASVSVTSGGATSSGTADQGYSVELTAPPVSVTVDPIAPIDPTETASSAPIAITGTASANVPAGTIVTVSVDGHTYTGTVQAGGIFSVNVPGNVLGGAAVDSVHVSLSVTDAAGNVANTAVDQSYSVESTSVSPSLALNSVMTINAATAASDAPVTVSGTAQNVPAGDIITMTVGSHSYTGAVGADGSFSIGIPGDILADSNSIHVSVSTVDAAGNVSTATADLPYSVNTVAAAISVGVDQIAPVNAAQAASTNPVAITGTVSANVIAGTVVTVTVDGHAYTGTVQNNGTYSVGVPGSVLATATTDSVQVSVSATDSNGNVATATLTQHYTVELTAPSITINIDPIATINGAQAASANPVAITGSVSANVPIGDTVTLSLFGQTQTYTGVVQSGGTFSIGIPGNLLANASTDSVHAVVSATDAAGNTAIGSADRSYTVELTAPPITITIDPVATINGAQAVSANPVAVSGTVSANVPVGTALTLSVAGQTYTGTVQAGGEYSVGIPGNVLANATTDSIHATISSTDAAGNTATASADRTYTVELTAPPITIAIDPIAPITATEAVSSAPVNVTGTVSTNVPVGTALTLTVNGHVYTGTVQAGDTYSIGIPGNVMANAQTDSVHAAISYADTAGNVASASADRSYTIELVSTAINISIDPIATINGTAAVSANPVAITGTVSSNVPTGDTVTLTVDGQTYTGTVQAGGVYSIGVPGNVLANATVDSVHVSISVSGGSGSPLSASADQAYAVELTAPPISFSIDPLAVINAAQAASSATISITGTVSANVPVGETVTLTVGGQTYTGTVQAGGVFAVGIPGNVLANAPTDSIHGTISLTDAAGNTATATVNLSYTVEAAAAPISITIDPLATINGTQAASANPVTIAGTVSANVPVGATVNLVVSGQVYTGVVQTGGTYSIGIPGNVLANATTDSIHADITVTDAAGNTTSASTDLAYTVELTASSIAININPIATINGAEAASSNPIAVTGSVSSNVPVGTTVTLSVGGQNYTGAVQSGGTYSIGIPGNVLASAGVDSVHAVVGTTDAAGNAASTSADRAYTVELTAPPIAIGINPIAPINGAEAANANPVNISGTVSANVAVGTTVTLSVDSHSYTGTVQAGGTYSIGIPGNVMANATADNVHAAISYTDPAGNTATASANASYNVELVAAAISIGIDPIATINGTEAISASPINVTGTVSNNVPVGAIVTLTVDGHSYTSTVQAGGVYSVGIAGNVMANAGTDSVHASIAVTDAAGNVATANADQAYTVELVAPAISIALNPIAAITDVQANSANPIAITGTVSANVPVGDAVTLTLGTQTYTGTVQAGGTFSVGIPGNVLAAASSDVIHAGISTVDAAGNLATASASLGYSLSLTASSISIDPIVTINGATAASTDPVNITGSVSSSIAVGDTVTLTVSGQTYTGTVQAGGTYSIGIPGNVLGAASTDSIHASVTFTNPMGSTATVTADQSYSVELTAAPISVSLNPIATINGAEAASSNPIAITGTVSSNVPVGEMVGVTVNGQLYTGAVQAGGIFSVGVPGNVLANATTDSVHVAVSLVDSAGNIASTSADLAYTVELTAPPISVTLNSLPAITDAQASSSSTIAVTGTVSANVPVGDTVTLTVGSQTYTGTVQTGGSFSVGIPGNILANAATDSIHASLSTTDAAGNVATASTDLPYTVSLTASSISIDPIATVNGATAASVALVQVTGEVSSNVPVGDTVTLSVGGQSYTGTVQAGGTYSIGIPGNVLGSAGTDSVHASVSLTVAGNPVTVTADQSYTVELSAPPITIAINPITTVNGAEAASSNPLTITGSVSSNVPAGDTVTLTLDGQAYTGTVQANGTYSVSVPGNALGNSPTDSISVAISSTDAAGNVASASATSTYTVELAAPAISITINPIATVNGEQAASSSPIFVTGTVSSNVPVGTDVMLSVSGQCYTGIVQSGGTYSIGIPGNVLATATTDNIHASIAATDAAGNTASASANLAYTVELIAPPIVVSIDPIATLNGAEAASSTPIAITGTVSSNVPTGTTVSLTVDTQTYTGTVQAGGTYSIGIPGNVLANASVDNVHASVATTDAAGNTATTSADQTYSVELTAPPISIGINQIATINGAEAASSNPVPITGTVSANVAVGTTVTLTVDSNSYTGTVQAGGTYSIGIPGNVLANASTDNVHAAISYTDPAGNTATASADSSYTVELVAAAISIDIDPIATINGAEAISANMLYITGTVSSNVPVGAIVTLSVSGNNYTGTVHTGGIYSICIPGNVLAGATTDSVHASISVTDAAGNVASASADQTYSIELAAPAISVSLNSIATVTDSIANSSSPVTVTGSVSANVPAGDIVTLAVGNQTYTGTVQADGTFSVGIPGNVLALASNDVIHATISATDAAGNVANASANLSYSVSLTASSISIDPIVTINGAVAASSNPVAITGTVSANVPVGDTVSLTVNGQTYTGTVQADFTYSIGVPGNVLAGASTDSVHASVTLTVLGSPVTVTADQAYTVELAAAPITISLDTIATINGAEAASSNPVAITGTVSSNVPVGDIVTLTLDGQSYTGAVQLGGTYSIGVPGNVLASSATDSINVSVSATDASGNTASASANQTYTVELVAPAISISLNAIAAVGDAEAVSSATVTVSGTVSSNVPSGDIVTLTVGGQSYMGTVQTGGTFSINVPGSVLAAATSDTIHASISTTDAAGNIASASADLAYTVALSAPVIGIDPVITINAAIAGSAIPVLVTGTVSANVPVGDTVTLTLDGQAYTGLVLAGGIYSIGIPGNVLGASASDTIEASVTANNVLGNPITATVSLTYSVELVAAPISITVNPVLTINGAEAISANPIVVTGSVSGNVAVGTPVTLSVGGESYTGTVQVGGTYSVGIPGSILANAGTDSIHATVSTVDAAGNTASASADLAYGVELVAPVISVGLNAVGPITDALAAGTVAVTGNVSANVATGTIVTLSVGSNTYTGTVQAGSTFSINVPGNILAAASIDNIHASISTTDSAGNIASASADLGYSLSLSSPVVSLNAIATINGAQAASTSPVAITGTVSADVPVGTTVTLNVAGQTYTGTVQADDTFSIGVPGSVLGAATTDTATVSLTANNGGGSPVTVTASQSYAVELNAAPISIGLNAIATINGVAAASANLVAVTGTVSSNVAVGTIVNLSVGGQTYTGVVQLGDTFSIGVPGNVLASAGTDNLHASVSVVDAAGNVASASTNLAYAVELTAPAISVAIHPLAIVNGIEAASTNPIAVVGTVSANVPIGTIVTLSVGSNTYTGAVAAGDIFSIGVPGNILANAGTDSIQASISTTDAAGNVASSSVNQSYSVELTAPAISVAINPIITINGITGTSSAPVAITGTVSANVPVGDTVTLSVGANTYTGTVLAGGIFSIGVPGNVLASANTDTIHVSVSATDVAGNTASASANQAYAVELVAPAISVSINPIATITGLVASSSNLVPIGGTVSSNVTIGSTVTLTVGSHTYTGTVQVGGTFSIGIPGNILAGALLDVVQASVTSVDAAGNTATGITLLSYLINLLLMEEIRPAATAASHAVIQEQMVTVVSNREIHDGYMPKTHGVEPHALIASSGADVFKYELAAHTIKPFVQHTPVMTHPVSSGILHLSDLLHDAPTEHGHHSHHSYAVAAQPVAHPHVHVGAGVAMLYSALSHVAVAHDFHHDLQHGKWGNHV